MDTPALGARSTEGEAYTDYELRFEKDEAAELCTAVPSTGLIDVANRSKNPMVGKTLPLLA